MRRYVAKSVAALVIAVVSFGTCVGNPRRRGRKNNFRFVQNQGGHHRRGRGFSAYDAVRREIFAVQKMFKSLSNTNRSHYGLYDELCRIEDYIVEDMVDAYMLARGGAPRKDYDDYDRRRYNAQEQKHVAAFDADKVAAYAETIDYQLEDLLERGDRDLDRAINIVLAHHVARNVGARVDSIKSILAKELRESGIGIRGGFSRGDDFGEESTLTKLLKVALGAATVAGVATAGAYGVYRMGVDTKGKKVQGFWNWMLPRENTGFFSLDTQGGGESKKKDEKKDKDESKGGSPDIEPTTVPAK